MKTHYFYLRKTPALCKAPAVYKAIALATLVSLSTFAAAQLKQLDRVVAVVRQDVITESELNERIAEIRARVANNPQALPDEETLQNQILEHLILEQLQLQTAERAGLRIEDDEINHALENVRRQNGLSEQQFIEQLRYDGLSLVGFREKIRRELTIQHIQRGVVSQRIEISDLEIDTFLKSAEGKFWISAEYNLGHILIPLPQAPSKEDISAAQKHADALFQQLQQGANFQDLAIAHSKGPAALKGGDLGWRKTSDLPTLFAELVPTLEVGQVAKPSRSGAGFHILKLHQKRGDNTQVITQSKVRHILVKPSAILSDAEAKEKLQGIRKQLQEGAEFADMAKEHSEDIGSMLAGGDLGWSTPGQFVPEFEKVMSGIEVDEVSEPFRSQFGWHILQVTERREEDMTEKVIRNKAARVLTGRRFEDELQVWLREIRDGAFVEIKI